MKVLATIVVPPHMSVSGGARAGERLSAALAPHCDMHVASMLPGCDGGAAPLTSLAVETWLPPLVPWSLLSRRYATMFYRSDIPAILAARRFDLVHIHNPMPALEMERIACACRRAGTPYVVSTHGFNEIARGHDIYGFGAARRLAWRTLVFNPVVRAARSAAAVFALSPADYPILADMGITREAIHLVPNGVEVPSAGDAGDESVLGRLGIPQGREDGRLTCLFLANHTPNKGLPILLEAFTALSHPYRLIVGGEQRAEIDYGAWTSRTGRDQEILLTGRLTDAEVSALMRRCDLFVFPTLADTLPLVVLEAMAHGRPVVASKVGGIPFQLAGGCGVLIPPGDPTALAEAVGQLANSPEIRLAIGARARSRVEASFTWELAARKAIAGYRDVLSTRALGASSVTPTLRAAGRSFPSTGRGH